MGKLTSSRRRMLRRHDCTSAWSQHTAELRERCCPVCYVVDDEGADDEIEGVVVKWQRFAENRSLYVGRGRQPLARDPELFLACVNCRDGRTTSGELLGVEAWAAAGVKHSQAVDLSGDGEHSRAVIERVVRAVLGVRQKPPAHLVVDLPHRREDPIEVRGWPGTYPAWGRSIG